MRTRESEADADAVAVGRAIRSVRLGQRMTMVALGQQAGVSQSFLSEIEAGKRTPSLSTLFALAEQLGTSPAALLQPDTARADVVVARAVEGEKYQVSDIPEGGHFRLILRTGSVSTYEFVAAASDDLSGDFQHGGYEFLYVAIGALRVRLKDHAPIVLEQGDSIGYPGNRPHSWEVAGDEDVRILQVLDIPDSPAHLHAFNS